MLGGDFSVHKEKLRVRTERKTDVWSKKISDSHFYPVEKESHQRDLNRNGRVQVHC